MDSERSISRAAEVALATALALLTLPVLVMALAASYLTYRASPVFIHERIGRHGHPFRFVKIRTLPPSTSRYADKYSIGEDAIPRAMRAVRRMHLDELPQLWFVITGRMSLVGPRPEMRVLHERLHPIAAAERVSVRPGVTGLWQVSTHCDGLIYERIEYDRLYVRYRNARLDAWILARTAIKMLFGRRTHLHEVPSWAISAERPVTVRPLPVTRAMTIDVRTRLRPEVPRTPRDQVGAVLRVGD